MRRLARFIALVAALGAVGCGRDENLAPGATIAFRPSASGPTNFGDVPWPSDLYLDASGDVGTIPGLERIAGNHDTLQAGLSAMDGFGLSTGSVFFLDAEVDAASLPRTWERATSPDASVFVEDVDPSSASLGKRYPAYAKYLPTLGCISLLPVPGVALPPGVRHAAVVTTRVSTVDGRSLAPAPELMRIAKLAPNQRRSAAEKLYGGALAELANAGVGAEQVAGLAVYTTSQRVYELPALRERLQKEPDPAIVLDAAKAAPYTVAIFGVTSSPNLDDWLGIPTKDEKGVEWPGGDNPTGIAHDQIAVVASGAFVAPSLLDPKSKHFERDASGSYVIADANATIPVTLVIPKQPPPPAGYPVVINGHGLSNNRGSMLSVANVLAGAGFAVIGIDDVLHGARAGIKDVKNNYKGKYEGPDGIPDDLPLAVSFFAGFSDFVAVRDNFRQSILDQTSLVRLIRSHVLDLSGLAAAAGGSVPKLDPERIYWSGGSLGGIMGSMTVAVEPEIKAAAFQVPGAGFVDLITTNSAEVAGIVTTVAKGTFAVQGDEVFDEFHPIAALLGAITEAGDPISYAPHVMRDPLLPARTPPDIMITYAAYDEVLPNVSTLSLIRALGLELADPMLLELPGVKHVASPASKNLANGKTGVAVQYAPANHGLGYGRYDTRKFKQGVPFDGDPRFPSLKANFQIEMPVREHGQELAKFFQTANAGAAVVEVTAPPRADFDGDGVLDADEKAHGTDPEDPKSH